MRRNAAVESARRAPVRVLQGLALALCAVLAACSSAPPAPKPTSVKATVQAAADVNPDARKRASPLVVRIYELKSAAAFDAADFLSLYERDQATLAAEMVGREEFTMRPGEARPWEKIVGPEVRFIGVMAAYRDIEHARWKTLIALKPGLKNAVTIKADAITLTGSVVAQ
ncbi:MAG: type VI secretion system lipoprotein TssJ [Burkholderiales bacterium]